MATLWCRYRVKILAYNMKLRQEWEQELSTRSEKEALGPSILTTIKSPKPTQYIRLYTNQLTHNAYTVTIIGKKMGGSRKYYATNLGFISDLLMHAFIIKLAH